MCVCVLCAIKSQLTYTNPNWAFEVSEIYKEWLYFHHHP